ncbi:MAG TPA: hypothetical protein VMU17_00280 [Elusimicrobiota bacterium]|nr:hypothetical protein [Elusimicrobiota bacterium]
MNTHCKKCLALTLVIGWFVGAACAMVAVHFGQHGGHGHLRRLFARELKLTPQQQTQVDAILSSGRQQMQQIYADARPRLDAVRNSTRAQIRQLLSPEQQIAFDRLEAKRDARSHIRPPFPPDRD